MLQTLLVSSSTPWAESGVQMALPRNRTVVRGSATDASRQISGWPLLRVCLDLSHVLS